jgi:hypothetical protein
MGFPDCGFCPHDTEIAVDRLNVRYLFDFVTNTTATKQEGTPQSWTIMLGSSIRMEPIGNTTLQNTFSDLVIKGLSLCIR